VLDRLPIRWRLAAISALLTLFILSTFAVVMGELTARRVRNDFNNQLVAAIDNLAPQLGVEYIPGHPVKVSPSLDVVAAPENAAIRILAADGSPLKTTRRAPSFGFPVLGTITVRGYRVATRSVPLSDRSGTVRGAVFVQYGRRLSDLEATVRRIRLFLVFGVLAGTAAALAGGLILARRAMKPVAALTATSREIARTRDPNRRVPVPDADDEVSELARTLDEMLMALESSRAETSAMLDRQRQFVADASHELRTPLTSVLANLELLADVLDGERGETARSALRSSQRMRRLVADLLLLARADAPRTAPREPVDLGRVLVEAAAELGPVTAEHRLSVDADASGGALCVDGTRDELHRLALNLMENAVKHTPAGTAIRASVHRDAGAVELAVEDEGPGIDEDMRDRLFERFVRGAGDRGGSFGLGLSIVRAVADAHGGSVTVEDPPERATGARFVVRLPAAGPAGGADGTRAAEAPDVSVGA
jgi:two-component system, OmpR family, sensor kinase